MVRIKLSHNTEKYEIHILNSIEKLKIEAVSCNIDMHRTKCKSGCKNFNKKYSCPPYSPGFTKVSAGYSHMVVNCLKINSAELEKRYNSIRIMNVVQKSIQRKAFNYVAEKCKENNDDIYILENGSCRLCKKCNLQNNLPCKHPDLMRPSLEATGVDVNELVKTAFDFELQWYSKNTYPDYQCVVGGILTNTPEKIIQELSNYYEEYQQTRDN